MSLINFESSWEKDEQRKQDREDRNLILEKAKRDFEFREKKEKEAKDRGEHVWMLPSVEAKLGSSLSSTHKKKKEKKKKREKKRKQDKRFSSSDSDSEMQWVEKPPPKTIVSLQESSGTMGARSIAGGSTSSMDIFDANLEGGNARQEGWMEMSSLFGTFTRDEMRERDGTSRKNAKEEERKKKLEGDKPGSHNLELNPYYKDGGSGLPDEEVTPRRSSTGSATTGLNANWLRKALKRAQEQAQEEGKSLEDVAAQRWGSLEAFKKLLSDAEESERGGPMSRRASDDRSKEARYGHRRYIVENKREGSVMQRHREDNKWEESRDKHDKKWEGNRDLDDRKWDGARDKDDMKWTGNRDSYDKEWEGSRDKNDMKWEGNRDTYDREWEGNRDRHDMKWEGNRDSFDRKWEGSRNKPDARSGGSTESEGPRSRNLSREKTSRGNSFEAPDRSEKFKKPGDDGPSENIEHIEASWQHRGERPARLGWRKGDGQKERAPVSVKRPPPLSSSSSGSSDNSDDEKESSESSKEVNTPDEIVPPSLVLTDREMNELAAKIVKAELLGNQAHLEKLRVKLEAAKMARNAVPTTSGLKDAQGKMEEQVVILTRMDAKGFVKPVISRAEESRGGARAGKRKQVKSHGKDGQRERYFADDDKYDLKTMFEKEKGTSASEQNALFEQAAARNTQTLNDDFDVDDMFLGKEALSINAGKQQEKERKQAMQEHQRSQRSLEACLWCFDSKEMPKHLIVSLGTKAYICLPPHQSLTPGHCLVVPIHHTACATQADEDQWVEMQSLRKSLVQMFASRGSDVIFFENAMHLRHFPHMALHCVPVDRETGDMAPIYFKKAIQECESEWAQNKKLVELKDKDVRRCVPKGLPYFFVDFAMTSGYAHVIEEERDFPSYFAQEIIGGMLDLEPSLWRKPRRENFDAQRKKVVEFAAWYKDFDITQ